MNNNFMLLGRLVKTSKEETENGSQKVIVTLAVQQNFKNIDGVYDTNFIDCTLFGSIAQNTLDYIRKGDFVGIRGRIQRIDTEKPMELIAEKISFLSSKKEDLKECGKEENEEE